MRKRLIALVMAACMAAAPASCFAEDATDYSYLEDMTIKEIRELSDAVDGLLSGEKIDTDMDVDLEDMSVKELKALKNAINEILGDDESMSSDTHSQETVGYGTISGNITWYFNDYKGNVADTDSTVILMPMDGSAMDCPVSDSYTNWLYTKYMEQDMRRSYAEYNVFITEVDGSGQYHIQNVPEGEYKLYISSKNTNDGYAFDNRDSYMKLISEELSPLIGEENASQIAEALGYNKYHTQEITIYPSQETYYSYDFGMTYI